MEQMRVTRQVMDLQRATMDNLLSNVMILWDQTERFYDTCMGQAFWLPDEGKKAFVEWIRSNKKGAEEFKNALGEGFNRLDRCFAGAEQPQPQH